MPNVPDRAAGRVYSQNDDTDELGFLVTIPLKTGNGSHRIDRYDAFEEMSKKKEADDLLAENEKMKKEMADMASQRSNYAAHSMKIKDIETKHRVMNPKLTRP